MAANKTIIIYAIKVYNYNVNSNYLRLLLQNRHIAYLGHSMNVLCLVAYVTNPSACLCDSDTKEKNELGT